MLGSLDLPASLPACQLPGPLSLRSPLKIPWPFQTKFQWMIQGSGSFVAQRQCQFAWNGFLLTFSNGPHCASFSSPRVGFLVFVLWAFNAPFSGTHTSTPALPHPTLLSTSLGAPVPTGVGEGCRHARSVEGGAGRAGAQEAAPWKPSAQRSPVRQGRHRAFLVVGGEVEEGWDKRPFWVLEVSQVWPDSIVLSRSVPTSLERF